MRNDNSRILLIFLGSVALATCGAALLASISHLLVVPTHIDAAMFLARYRSQVQPEADERFVFTSVTVGTALVSLLACLRIFRPVESASIRPSTRLRFLIAAAAALIFLIPLSSLEFSTWLLNGKHVSPYHTGLLFAFFLASLCGYFARAGAARHATRASKISSFFIWTAFLAVMFLQIAAWRVVGLGSVSNFSGWNVHFDAVIYTVSQVVQGRTLLVDLPSQYGMFPEFVAPVFKLVGLSTLSFTIVFAVLQIIGLSSLMHVLQRTVRDPALKLAAAIAILMVTFETCLWILGLEERYFQYWPVRFFWPALAVLLFYRYSRTRSVRSAAVLSLAGAVGALWNADSGLMIEIAFAAYLVLKIIIGGVVAKERVGAARQLARALGFHVLIGIMVAAAFFGYLHVKSSSPIQWSWLYDYQITFYELGFTMMRMPTYPSPWMAVLAVYLMGIIVAFAGLVRRPGSWRLDNILFISMLGVGIFVYYQGRSHILNLISVSWPAVLVGAMLADRALRAVRTATAGRELLVLPAAALGILVFCAAPLLWSLPRLVHASIASVEQRGVAKSAVVQDEISFIRAHSVPGEECLILALRQGIYYAEAGLVSPLRGPGYVETVLQSDQDRFLNEISTRRPHCVFLGVGDDSAQDLGPRLAEVLDSYVPVAKSHLGTMIYLSPLP